MNRVLARFPPHITDDERMSLQSDLTPLIVRLLWENASFRYYQGMRGVRLHYITCEFRLSRRVLDVDACARQGQSVRCREESREKFRFSCIPHTVTGGNRAKRAELHVRTAVQVPSAVGGTDAIRRAGVDVRAELAAHVVLTRSSRVLAGTGVFSRRFEWCV